MKDGKGYEKGTVLRRGRLRFPIALHELFVLLGGVDAVVADFCDGDRYVVAVLQNAQLLQRLSLFQRRSWERDLVQQEVAAIDIEADVFERINL